MMTDKKISVVIPCRNEEANILPMYERLVKVFFEITADYEFIYTDNASTDNSEKIFRDLAAKDQRVKVIFFSRNFGTSDHGYTAGTELAAGEAVVWIDGDIQDPPRSATAAPSRPPSPCPRPYERRRKSARGPWSRTSRRLSPGSAG